MLASFASPRPEGGALKGRVDWAMVGAIVILLCVGTLAILSAAAPLPFYGQIVRKHFTALGLGALLYLFGLGFNYQIYQDQAKTLYVFTLLLMVSVLVFGEVQRGQRAWLRLPFFSFQPSELARICTILILANYLDRRAARLHEMGSVLGAFALTAPIILLILKEPDFSSTLSFFPLLLGMLFCGGASLGYLGAMAAYGLLTLTLPLLWTLVELHPAWLHHGAAVFFLRLSAFGWPLALTLLGLGGACALAWRWLLWMRIPLPGVYAFAAALILAAGLGSAALVHHQLKGYQRNRFVAFLLPEADARGAGYNVRQAQVAIGSGGLWGKGIFSGTQSKLGFLPERHTDFIYAVVGEELGFAGALGVLMVYSVLLWRIVSAGRAARDRYGYLVCCGMASVYAFHLLVNVGMCLGLMPVAGIPLPLLSYGGSHLAMTLLALGVVSNIYSKRYAFI